MLCRCRPISCEDRPWQAWRPRGSYRSRQSPPVVVSAGGLDASEPCPGGGRSLRVALQVAAPPGPGRRASALCRHSPAVHGEPDQHANLRKRVRYHHRGNAAGSTLRLTLGCLRGLELRRVGSGKRMTFGKVGEDTLSQWMADNARVCWVEQDEPWASKLHSSPNSTSL
ncbi:GIY-YIG nuclease family protein [Streptomyces tibetensis]|uniref:GIY-YIG nuclease family protein n=1 Tax=Streptomyces tibetensis TaxID=2382123 RepID=UPI0037F55DA1